MKIKIFAHDDYDASGCAILAHLIFENVEVEFHNYGTIDKRIAYFISKKEYESYDCVFVLDISVNANVAKLINSHVKKNGLNLKLIDHHESALFLNQYFWAWVSEYKEGTQQKTCATLAFRDFLVSQGTKEQVNILNAPEISDLIEGIRLYDSYEWHDAEPYVLERYRPKQFNDLMYLVGKKRFIEIMLNKLKSKELSLTDTEKMLLTIDAEKFESYLRSRNKSLIIKEINGYQAGIVFGENYINELSDKLMELHTELDFIAVIYLPFKISFRTNKPDVNLLDIVQKYGGGGHPQSAGCSLNKEIVNDIVGTLFKINS